MSWDQFEQMVYEFQGKLNREKPDFPKPPSLTLRILSARLILEEAFEMIEKGLGLDVVLLADSTDSSSPAEWGVQPSERNPDMVEIVDGAADVHFVITACMHLCGVPEMPFLLEIAKNNLTKFGPGGYMSEHGKWIKPPTWQPPDVEGLLTALGWCKMCDSDEKCTVHGDLRNGT